MTILVITDKYTCQTKYGESMVLGGCAFVKDKDTILICDRDNKRCRTTGVDERQLMQILTDHYLNYDNGINEIHLPRISDNLFYEARLQKCIIDRVSTIDGEMQILHV